MTMPANSVVGESLIDLGELKLLIRPTNDSLARWESKTGKSFLSLSVQMTGVASRGGLSSALALVRIEDMRDFFLCTAATGVTEVELLEAIDNVGLAAAASQYITCVMQAILPAGKALEGKKKAQPKAKKKKAAKKKTSGRRSS